MYVLYSGRLNSDVFVESYRCLLRSEWRSPWLPCFFVQPQFDMHELAILSKDDLQLRDIDIIGEVADKQR